MAKKAAAPEGAVPSYINPNLVGLLRPIADLRVDPKNARKHPERNLTALRKSLEGFRQQKPIVVKSDGTCVAGSGTLVAAQALGWQYVAAVVFDGTAEQAAAYGIADNQTGALAEWDEDNLPAILASLNDDLLGFTGFEDDEINVLLKRGGGGGDGEGNTDPDDVPEEPVKVTTRKGDLWLLGEHRLLCGSCTEVADVDRLMDGAIAALMNTDPPYGIDYSKIKDHIPRGGFIDHQKRWGDIENDTLIGDDMRDFLAKFFAIAQPRLTPDAAYYIWHPSGEISALFADAMKAAKLLIHRNVIWIKPGFVLSRFGMYHAKHEECFYGWVRGNVPPWHGDKSQTTAWEAGRDDDSGQHPTQKPVELFRRPMLNHTLKGDVVYEPFSGSGSQIIAAQQLDRRCYAIDIAPRYVDVAVLRWQAFTGLEARLSDGRTFAEVAAERGELPAAQEDEHAVG